MTPNNKSIYDAKTKTLTYNKYSNRKTEVDGIVFDSVKEARRYQELKLLQKAGHIQNLQWQVPYKLVVNGHLIATYKADFVYTEFDTVDRSSKFVVEDVKGARLQAYQLKKKLMLACYGIEIKET